MRPTAPVTVWSASPGKGGSPGKGSPTIASPGHGGSPVGSTLTRDSLALHMRSSSAAPLAKQGMMMTMPAPGTAPGLIAPRPAPMMQMPASMMSGPPPLMLAPHPQASAPKPTTPRKRAASVGVAQSAGARSTRNRKASANNYPDGWETYGDCSKDDHTSWVYNCGHPNPEMNPTLTRGYEKQMLQAALLFGLGISPKHPIGEKRKDRTLHLQELMQLHMERGSPLKTATMRECWDKCGETIQSMVAKEYVAYLDPETQKWWMTDSEYHIEVGVSPRGVPWSVSQADDGEFTLFDGAYCVTLESHFENLIASTKEAEQLRKDEEAASAETESQVQGSQVEESDKTSDIGDAQTSGVTGPAAQVETQVEFSVDLAKLPCGRTTVVELATGRSRTLHRKLSGGDDEFFVFKSKGGKEFVCPASGQGHTLPVEMLFAPETAAPEDGDSQDTLPGRPGIGLGAGLSAVVAGGPAQVVPASVGGTQGQQSAVPASVGGTQGQQSAVPASVGGSLPQGQQSEVPASVGGSLPQGQQSEVPASVGGSLPQGQQQSEVPASVGGSSAESVGGEVPATVEGGVQASVGGSSAESVGSGVQAPVEGQVPASVASTVAKPSSAAPAAIPKVYANAKSKPADRTKDKENKAS